MERAEPRPARFLGSAIGAATGPVAAFGQSWAGTGDGRLHVWLLATALGALLGAVVYPTFWRDEDLAAGRQFGVGFGALFGFAVGLVAGALAAFPMGAVMGALGGLVAGAGVAFAGRRLAPVRGGLALASLLGAGLALVCAWAWLS
jgi:hypothetical protein